MPITVAFFGVLQPKTKKKTMAWTAWTTSSSIGALVVAGSRQASVEVWPTD